MDNLEIYFCTKSIKKEYLKLNGDKNSTLKSTKLKILKWFSNHLQYSILEIELAMEKIFKHKASSSSKLATSKSKQEYKKLLPETLLEIDSKEKDNKSTQSLFSINYTEGNEDDCLDIFPPI